MIQVTYKDHMGSDLSVVNSARVSFGKASEWAYLDWRHSTMHPQRKMLSDRDTKLIKYLAKHKHISPFGHCFASFHVKAPIFVARQLVKHKFLRWNEISRRYVDDEPEFYIPDVWRGRSKDKKQGSEGTIPIDKICSHTGDHIKDYWHKTVDGIEGTPYEDGRYFPEQSIADDIHFFYEDEVLDLYNKLINAGVAPEQARMVLPTSLMTEWYWSGSLDAFADMCGLRCSPDTQHETWLVADQISQKMKELFPVCWEALMENKNGG